MIFLANVLTFCGLMALGFLFKSIEWTWGQDTMVVFALGWIAATVMWQTAHRIRYGLWFDPPAINGDSDEIGARAAKPRGAAGAMPKIEAGGLTPPPAIKF